VGRLIERARSIRLGDPLLPKTQMGPVATLAQLDKNQRLVKEALADGASLLTGGQRVESPTSPGGYFFEPTVLGAVQTGNRILHTEAFGPILAVVPFDDEEEAVRLANASEFGLGAGIWTSDVKRAHRVASRLQVGTVWVNMYRTLGFNSPVTGRKQSGLGVQNGQEAILQYLQTKSVWCEIGDGVSDQFAA
jgi:aldehyde dehydrogenase (NAD+)